MGRTVFLLLFIGLIVLMDWYLYRNFRIYFHDRSVMARRVFTIVWWSVPVILLVLFLTFGMQPRWLRLYAQNFLFIIFFAKLLAAVFMLLGDSTTFFISLAKTKAANQEAWLSRRLFVARFGTVMAAIPFLTMANGLVRTATHFRIHRVKLKLPNLPAAFNGFRLVQISDIHTGSWIRKGAMQDMVDMIHRQEPDIICFTGDIVNNRTDEANGFVEYLRQLKAPGGVYSILGNHDYGDYEQWPNEAAKAANMQAMFELHRQIGWDLLLNEHRIFEREGEKLALIGIENWGHALRFPKYGKLNEAHAGTEQLPFKILLSHDPSHWDAQVVPEYGDIDITLSGHTHGFQFGVELWGIKWSPSQYVYKQWAGLYQRGKQYLYVNRGTGCLGYSGRIGIRPEITVIELERG